MGYVAVDIWTPYFPVYQVGGQGLLLFGWTPGEVFWSADGKASWYRVHDERAIQEIRRLLSEQATYEILLVFLSPLMAHEDYFRQRAKGKVMPSDNAATIDEWLKAAQSLVLRYEQLCKIVDSGATEKVKERLVFNLLWPGIRDLCSSLGMPLDIHGMSVATTDTERMARYRQMVGGIVDNIKPILEAFEQS